MDKTDNLKTALRCFGFALIMLLSSLTAVAQSKLASKVTLDESKATVETILKKIETQTGLSVVISTEQAKKMPLISITAHGKSVKQVLDEIADKANCAYKVSGEIVTVYMPSKRIVSGVVMDEKETKNVKVSDLWTEFFHNRPLRIVALFFITAFAMMSVGNAAGAYFMNDLEQQSALAQEGIRWLVCVIPAILLGLAMFIISKYELTDEVIDDINKKIEARHKEEN